MSDYDAILHFERVHTAQINKYFALRKHLSKLSCKALLIINKSEGFGKGATTKDIQPFSQYLKNGNAIHCTMEEAKSVISDTSPKLYLYGSEGTKKLRPQVTACNKRKIDTIQVSTSYSPLDQLNFGSKIISTVNKYIATSLTYKPKEVWFSNCFMWDNISDFLPYTLSRDEFCRKYGLNPKKDIFIWMPNALPPKRHNRDAYKQINSIENLVIKLHPREYRRLSQEKITPTLYPYKRQPKNLIDPVDSHWAYVHADCAIVHNSTVVFEMPFYQIPTICVDHVNGYLDKYVISILPDWKFKWAGTSTMADKLPDVIAQKIYQTKDENMYDDYLKWILHDPNISGMELLSKQVVNLLKRS